MRTDCNAKEKGARETIVSWHPYARLWLGLFLCALATTYTVIAVVAVFGVWQNTFTHWGQNLLGSLPLVIANAVGWKFKKLVAANLVAIGLNVVLQALLFGYLGRTFNLSWDWPLLVADVLLPLCNVRYFRAWCRAAQLD